MPYFKLHIPNSLFSFVVAILFIACSKQPDTDISCNTNELPFSFYKTSKDHLQKYQPASCDYSTIYINGVNLGIGTPGKYAGDLETGATYEDYMRWFQMMKDAGLNQIRIYTIHMSFFYDALYDFNTQLISNGQEPLLLFHGIWLDEFEQSTDLVSKTDIFSENIKEVVDAIHGNTILDFQNRPGKGYGVYFSDISPWVIGWILGREIHPDEVELTNSANAELSNFSGVAFSVNNVSPMEVWLTQQMDYIIQYERENYEIERPVSYSSWPTLDPLNHPTENLIQNNNYEDRVSVDLSNLDASNAPAGVFFSFHAYPYYPDFISEDPIYRNSEDSQGPNSYLAYLISLKNHYNNFPVLIAEYGTPSSWGNVHSAHNGIHHGGHSEQQQGLQTLRMMKNIEAADMAGGLLFAWLDEWWKPTWLTNEFDFPFTRRAYWHNIMAPEQNYGLIGFESIKPEPTILKNRTDTENLNGTSVTTVTANADTAFYYLDLNLTNNLSESDELLIALDTYDDIAGEVNLSNIPIQSTNTIVTQQASEFLIHIFYLDGEWEAQLYVTEAYNLYGLWGGEIPVNDTTQKMQSIPSDSGVWEKVVWKTNYSDYSTEFDSFYQFPSNYNFSAGKLNINTDTESNESNDAITISDKQIKIRIPWSLLQFTDPSQLQVFHDDKISTPDTWYDSVTSKGIAAAIVYNGNIEGESERFIWNAWKTDPIDDVMPTYIERKKSSYTLIKNALNP